jgi:carbamoyl-phosphate synthase large subunit
MKATGEVMAIGTSFEMALMKAIRSLEENVDGLIMSKYTHMTNQQLYSELKVISHERILVIAELLRRKQTIEQIHKITTIDSFFLNKLAKIVACEKTLSTKHLTSELLRHAKFMGFSDRLIGQLTNRSEANIKQLRLKYQIIANFKTVDTCANEFDAKSAYYYSDYHQGNEVETKTKKKKILIIGSGPIRIGQGIEFDYCSVHCV